MGHRTAGRARGGQNGPIWGGGSAAMLWCQYYYYSTPKFCNLYYPAEILCGGLCSGVEPLDSRHCRGVVGSMPPIPIQNVHRICVEVNIRPDSTLLFCGVNTHPNCMELVCCGLNTNPNSTVLLHSTAPLSSSPPAAQPHQHPISNSGSSTTATAITATGPVLSCSPK